MNKKNYLINLTFYAGSNLEEDTDNEIYFLETEKKLNKEWFVKRFEKTNEYLKENTDIIEYFGKNSHVMRNKKIQSSYIDGININTLVNGFYELTGLKLKKITEETPMYLEIPNLYDLVNHSMSSIEVTYLKIEQWE